MYPWLWYAGAVAINGTFFTSGHNIIYLKYAKCRGYEVDLPDCYYDYYTRYDDVELWYDDNRAGVACETNNSAGNLSCSTHHAMLKFKVI